MHVLQLEEAQVDIPTIHWRWDIIFVVEFDCFFTEDLIERSLYFNFAL